MIKISWLEKKNEDWKIATLTNEAGAQFQNVSINRVSKKGETFPNFDTLTNSSEVDGVLWQSPKGGWYLFPPKPETPQGGAPRGNGGAYKSKQIMEAMDTKARNIAEAQDRTAWMWAKNNASQLLSGDSRFHGMNSDEIAERVITLATKIYNGEPAEPFTTPKQKETTPDLSPAYTEEEISGDNIPF